METSDFNKKFKPSEDWGWIASETLGYNDCSVHWVLMTLKDSYCSFDLPIETNQYARF